MLVIRLSRVGRENQPAYRMVVADKRNAVKGKHLEVLGYYNVFEGKKIDFDKERIAHWMSKGAKPSDSLAAILKEHGMSGMEKFMEPRTKKRRKKGAQEEAATPAAAPVASAAVSAAQVVTPAEVAEAAPAPAEAPAPEAPAEAPSAETPAA